jgi:membrane associated rhomboid family serine protease
VNIGRLPFSGSRPIHFFTTFVAKRILKLENAVILLPFRDNVKKYGTGFSMWIFLAFNIFVGLKFMNLPVGYADDFLKDFAINSADQLTTWQFLCKGLISIGFHNDFLHLFSNMLFLFIFGFAFVETLGVLLFLVLYYGAGLSGWFIYRLFTYSALPAIGASGAISGLMAAYLVLFPRARLYSLWLFFWFVTIVRVPAAVYVGFWIVTQYFLALYDKASFIAYEAHLGGIVFGLIFGTVAKFLLVDSDWIQYEDN